MFWSRRFPLRLKFDASRRPAMRWRKALLAMIGCSLAAGCAPRVTDAPSSSESSPKDQFFVSGERQYVSVSEEELEQLIRTNPVPVLVEYGVDFNCVRCDQMTPSVNQLAQQFHGRAQIVRTQFNPASTTQRRQGIHICPTYQLFSNGKLIARCEGPTTLPKLKSKLTSMVARSSNSSELTPPLVVERF